MEVRLDAQVCGSTCPHKVEPAAPRRTARFLPCLPLVRPFPLFSIALSCRAFARLSVCSPRRPLVSEACDFLGFLLRSALVVLTPRSYKSVELPAAYLSPGSPSSRFLICVRVRALHYCRNHAFGMCSTRHPGPSIGNSVDTNGLTAHSLARLRPGPALEHRASRQPCGGPRP